MSKKHKNKKQYSFPILKRKEIITCMKELGISISELDLKAPRDEEQFKVIYAEILEKLMGINVLTTAVPHSKLEFFQYPQLHESSITSIRLFRELIKFMQNVGVADFSISDLIAPESARTIRNLSAIINYARWREQKIQLYLSQKCKMQELNHNLKVKKAENMKLADEFVQLNTKKKHEKPQVDALLNEKQELLKTMERTNTDIENKGDIVQNIKREYKKLKALDSEKKAILNQNTETIQSLEKKIVKSPERIKKELKLLSNTIQKEKIDINTMQQTVSYMKNKSDQLKLFAITISKRNDEMNEIHLLKNDQYKNLNQEKLKAVNIKKGKEKELKSITKQNKMITINLNTKKSEYAELQQQHKAKRNEINIINERITHLTQQHSKERIEKQTKISNFDKQIAAKKESIDNLLKENKNEINKLNAKYKQLVHSVDGYHENMRKAMSNW